jgi:prepilin-type N-terminal cleavage/methylation domain-containing protein
MPLIHTQKTIRSRGFTLVEMIVAVGLFAIVMTVASGAIFSIVDANRQAQSLNSVITNLNFAVESMLRDIRTGYDYSCLDSSNGAGGTFPSIPNDTNDCAVSGGYSVSLINSAGDSVLYSFDSANHQIVKTVYNHLAGTTLEGGITAPEVHIESMVFYVDGSQAPAAPASPSQPHMLVRIKGYAGLGKNQSNFDIQTFVSQRVLNL